MKYEDFIIDILDVIIVIITMGNEIFQPHMKILGKPLYIKKLQMNFYNKLMKNSCDEKIKEKKMRIKRI